MALLAGGRPDTGRSGVRAARRSLRAEAKSRLVGILVHAARIPRRSRGVLPDVFQGPQGICLPAEDREPGQVPYQPGFGAADVSAVSAGDDGRGSHGGEVMARWSSVKDVLVMAVTSWRLWLLQVLGNIVIFLIFIWWLRPHEASGWQL